MPLAAALIPALIGGAAAIGGAVISSNASKKAASAATAAADTNNATQLAIYNGQRADFAPYRDLGISAMPEIQRMLRIGPYASRSNAFAPANGNGRTGVVGTQGFGGYSGGKTPGGNAGTSPIPRGFETAGGDPAMRAGTSAGATLAGLGSFPRTYDASGLKPYDPNAPVDPSVNYYGGQNAFGAGGDDFGGGAPGTMSAQGGGPDWNAYLQANPDVAAEFQRAATIGDPNSPAFARAGLDSPEHYAQLHYQNHGQAEGRQLPTMAGGAPAPSGGQGGAGGDYGGGDYADDGSNPNGFGPDVSPYQSPDMPTFGPRSDATRPSAGAAPRFGPQDVGGTPTFLPQDVGSSPTFAHMDPGAAEGIPDLSADSYRSSPGYDFALKEGMRNLNANFGARGILQSGGAIEEAMRFGQGLASQDYNNWRANQLAEWQAKTGQFNVDRATRLGQANLENDRDLSEYTTDRGVRLGQRNLEADRDLGQANTDRAVRLNQGNLENDRTLSQFNTDRSVLNNNFDIDTSRADARYDADRGFTYGAANDARNFGYGQWQDQRNYDTNRFDTRYGNLMGLVGVGSGATGSTAAAGANYGNAFSANNTARADAVGNSAIANANNVNGLIGNAFSAYGMYSGLRGQPTRAAGAR